MTADSTMKNPTVIVLMIANPLAKDPATSMAVDMPIANPTDDFVATRNQMISKKIQDVLANIDHLLKNPLADLTL